MAASKDSEDLIAVSFTNIFLLRNFSSIFKNNIFFGKQIFRKLDLNVGVDLEFLCTQTPPIRIFPTPKTQHLPYLKQLELLEDEYKSCFLNRGDVPYNDNMARMDNMAPEMDISLDFLNQEFRSFASRVCRDKMRFFLRRVSDDSLIVGKIFEGMVERLCAMEKFMNDILIEANEEIEDWDDLWGDASDCESSDEIDESEILYSEQQFIEFFGSRSSSSDSDSSEENEAETEAEQYDTASSEETTETNSAENSDSSGERQSAVDSSNHSPQYSRNLELIQSGRQSARSSSSSSSDEDQQLVSRQFYQRITNTGQQYPRNAFSWTPSPPLSNDNAQAVELLQHFANSASNEQRRHPMYTNDRLRQHSDGESGFSSSERSIISNPLSNFDLIPSINSAFCPVPIRQNSNATTDAENPLQRSLSVINSISQRENIVAANNRIYQHNNSPYVYTPMSFSPPISNIRASIDQSPVNNFVDRQTPQSFGILDSIVFPANAGGSIELSSNVLPMEPTTPAIQLNALFQPNEFQQQQQRQEQTPPQQQPVNQYNGLSSPFHANNMFNQNSLNYLSPSTMQYNPIDYNAMQEHIQEQLRRQIEIQHRLQQQLEQVRALHQQNNHIQPNLGGSNM